MVDLHRMRRAVPIVLYQSLRLQPGAVQGQRPGFAHAAHVGQGLLDDDPAYALGVENFKHQIQVAVTDFMRANQFG